MQVKEDNEKRLTLVSMGGVDSFSSILPFLFRMFTDNHILPLPSSLRFIIALAITACRAKQTWDIYKNAGPSPVRQITERIKAKLSEKGIESSVAYLYSQPVFEKASTSLVLYPFYSHSTHGRVVENSKCVVPPLAIFPEFFDLVEERLRKELDALEDTLKPAVLFSAHSLPERLAQRTRDPYRRDIETFVRYMSKRFCVPVFLSFQSRLGPVEWFEPTTESMIKKLAKRFDTLILFPVSFAIDNTETVHEMDVLYARIAKQCGVRRFIRVSCFNDDDRFVDLLVSSLSRYWKCASP